MTENSCFGAKKGRVGRVNFNLYHYAGNNPVRYTDPDGRIQTAWNQTPGENNIYQPIKEVNTGNKAADYVLGALASTLNLVGGGLNVLSNSFVATSDAVDSAIAWVDDKIPNEFSLTGQGFRQDLYELEAVGMANPTLLPKLALSVKECLAYVKGAYSEASKLKYISSLISNGRVEGNSIFYNLDDKTQIIFRKDFGEKSHPILPKYPTATNHYNIEIQKYSEKRHQFKTWKDYHIIVDNNNKVIDYFEQ